jgi:hypothetical protein
VWHSSLIWTIVVIKAFPSPCWRALDGDQRPMSRRIAVSSAGVIVRAGKIVME